MTFEQLVLWVWTLPHPLQAACISGGFTLSAALLALIGVRLTLRHNRRKHVEDRELALKKETFLNIIDAAHRIMQQMDDYARGESDAASDLLLDFLALSSRLKLLGDRRARDAGQALTGAVSRHFNAASMSRARIEMLNRRIARLRALGEHAKDGAEAIREAITQHQKAIEKEKAERSQSVDGGTTFARALRDAMICFRVELGLDADAQWFQSPPSQSPTKAEVEEMTRKGVPLPYVEQLDGPRRHRA